MLVRDERMFIPRQILLKKEITKGWEMEKEDRREEYEEI